VGSLAESHPTMARRPDFLKLWAGQTVSLFGTQITEIALPLAAVLVLHASAVQLGVLNAARWLPFLLFTLWAGALADRVRRLPLLIGADVFRALVMAAIVGLAVVGWLGMPLLVALVFVFGAFTVLFEVSYYSFVPCVVPHEELVAANSRLQASASLAQVGGPSLGGFLVQLLSAPFALAADAVSFVVSALSLFWIRTREQLPPTQDDEGSALARIRAGLAITYRNPYLRGLIGTAGSYNFFDQWIRTLFMLYAIRSLGLSPGLIGLVLSAGAFGALVGSVTAGSAVRGLGLGHAVLWSVVLECVAFLAIPFAPVKHPLTVPLLLAGFALNGVGVAMSSVAAITIRQVVTPAHILGRMNASYRFVSFGAISIGAMAGGLAGQYFGLRIALGIGAILLLAITVTWVVLSPVRHLRDLSSLGAEPGRPTRS
jgi:MFS family permease